MIRCVCACLDVFKKDLLLDYQVDRHIRLLDQFIKEQEALLGPEPNRPVMLSMSDLFVPKWSRSTRVSMSPIFDEEQIATDIQQAEVSVHSDRSSRRRSLKNRRHKEKEKEKEKEEPPAPLALRITLPPPHHGMLDDPNEPTWCYCTRVSFGEVSAPMWSILIFFSDLSVDDWM